MASKTAGRVAHIAVKEGEFVEQGQLLAQQLALARFKRTEQLAKQGSMSQQDLDNAHAALIGAEAAA